MHRRPRILGFGPVGWALLIPLGALIWVAWTGYDLRDDLLRLITDVLGPQAMIRFVIYGIHGHGFALNTPHFSLTVLCGVLLILHLSPRRPRPWRYAALVLWAIASPSLLLVVSYSFPTPPAWFPTWSPSPWTGSWQIALHLLVGVGTVLCLWVATRSRAVALMTLAAVLPFYTLHHTPLAWAVPPISYFPTIAWHAVIFAIVVVWVVRQWRAVKPEYACQTCGYDLRGLKGPMCPECGAAAPAESKDATAPPPPCPPPHPPAATAA